MKKKNVKIDPHNNDSYDLKEGDTLPEAPTKKKVAVAQHKESKVFRSNKQALSEIA